jgi:Ni,Fe-hydrogenase I cytochrome b subunit
MAHPTICFEVVRWAGGFSHRAVRATESAADLGVEAARRPRGRALEPHTVRGSRSTGPAAWRDSNATGVSAIDLTQLNVWLDVIFSALYVVVLVALCVHFIASIPVGRFRKKWILKQWPEHDEPHPPALPKYIHFQHLAMMFLLGFTGLSIRFTLFDGARTTMRDLHYVAMVIVTITLFWRFWYAFFSKRRDWRAFAITKADVMSTIGVMMYYAFISNKKPHTAKYNVMQKATYVMFAGLMCLQALSGFSLLEFWRIPILGLTASNILLGWWLAPMVGGLAMAVAWMRVLHYTITWLFIILVTIHMYLSATEDIPVTLDFFGFGKEHEEEHGHETVPAPAPLSETVPSTAAAAE